MFSWCCHNSWHTVSEHHCLQWWKLIFWELTSSTENNSQLWEEIKKTAVFLVKFHSWVITAETESEWSRDLHILSLILILFLLLYRQTTVSENIKVDINCLCSDVILSDRIVSILSLNLRNRFSKTNHQIILIL